MLLPWGGCLCTGTAWRRRRRNLLPGWPALQWQRLSSYLYGQQVTWWAHIKTRHTQKGSHTSAILQSIITNLHQEITFSRKYISIFNDGTFKTVVLKTLRSISVDRTRTEVLHNLDWKWICNARVCNLRRYLLTRTTLLRLYLHDLQIWINDIKHWDKDLLEPGTVCLSCPSFGTWGGFEEDHLLGLGQHDVAQGTNSFRGDVHRGLPV